MNWEEKLNKFLETFEHKDDMIGVLVCGSFITGSPSTHSDLDVHIILKDKVTYRERGNKIIDGLLIEYFSNPPKQIKKYFEEDYKNISSMSQTQFATGKIIQDTNGIVQSLKDEAERMLSKKFADIDTSINELQKYGLWDMLDDLKDLYEKGKDDFDFIYYVCLDKLIKTYMRYIKYPYNKKSILGNITSEIVRKKYLLNELPDKNISDLIYKCIIEKNKINKIKYYEQLTNMIMTLLGGFDIGKFKFKSSVEE